MEDIRKKINLDEIKSGDLLFFSNNTPTGIILRTSTSTLWSHTGIAIRIKRRKRRDRKKRDKWEVSVDHTGILCVMEINANPRIDMTTGKFKAGFGFSSIDWVLKNQTVAGVRRMKDKFRTQRFAENTKRFARVFDRVKFPDYFSPFLNVWIGYPLTGTGIRESKGDIELFCSEMMAYFYIYVFLPFNFNNYNKDNFAIPLINILGDNCPHLPELIAPKHFEPHHSPKSSLFEHEIRIAYVKNDNVSTILLAPAVITLGICTILFLTLPGNDWRSLSNN